MLQPQQAAVCPYLACCSSDADTVTACSVSVVLQKDNCQTLRQQGRHRSIPCK